MLHKGFGGVAGLGVGGFVGFAANALQGGQSPSGTYWLWAAAVVSLVVGIASSVGWLLTRDQESLTAPSRVEALADRGSNALAAGRDVRIGTYNAAPAAPAAPQPKEHPRPSFDLTHQPAPDGWVHLMVANVADAGSFHADVMMIDGAREPQTTPYLVMWRDANVDERRIVTQSLINLGRILWRPGPDDDDYRGLHGHRRGGWRSGYFQLFSFSQTDGWVVEALDYDPHPATSMPLHVRLLFEEITVFVRVTRIDSNEQRVWRVTLGFTLPKLDSDRQQWVLPSEIGYRVEISEVG